MQFYINICDFFCFFNRFTCAHNSKIWNKNKWKKEERTFWREQAMSSTSLMPGGQAWGITPMEKAAADLLKKKK